MTNTETTRRGFPWQRIFGALVIVLAVMTVLQGVVVSQDNRRIAQCVARYSNGFSDALDARSKSSGQSQRALDEMVTAIRSTLAKPGTTSGQQSLHAAIDKYLAQRQEVLAEQRRHPYPPPPRDACKR
jgi:aminoglycoside phosphotransferase family enzyme